MPIAPTRISPQLAGGEWLIVFNKTIRRRVILHPPQDPEFRNWLIRSADRGAELERTAGGAGLRLAAARNAPA